MPEVAEVELICRELQDILTGSEIFSSVDGLLYSDIGKDLIGLTITQVKRRGKFLLAVLSDNRELIIHLGMTGAVLLHQTSAQKHTHLHLTLKHLGNLVDFQFVDPRRFGKISLVHRGEYVGLLSKLGPEFFEDKHPAHKLQRSRKPVKALLLDQQFMAGLGNYLCDEILFDAGIDPRRSGNSLTTSEVSSMVTSARKVVSASLASGGLSFSDYRHTDGSSGKFANSLKVYGRSGEPCHTCSRQLSTINLAGRTTTFCTECQK